MGGGEYDRARTYTLPGSPSAKQLWSQEYGLSWSLGARHVLSKAAIYLPLNLTGYLSTRRGTHSNVILSR